MWCELHCKNGSKARNECGDNWTWGLGVDLGVCVDVVGNVAVFPRAWEFCPAAPRQLAADVVSVVIVEAFVVVLVVFVEVAFALVVFVFPKFVGWRVVLMNGAPFVPIGIDTELVDILTGTPVRLTLRITEFVTACTKLWIKSWFGPPKP